MANNTVYPYGPGGQLPENIGLVNDLYTGGADKALTASAGREAGEKLSRVETIDLHATPRNVYWIGADGNANTTGYPYGDHYRVSLECVRFVRIKANDTNADNVAAISFASAYAQDGTWTLVPGTGRTLIPTGPTQTVLVPSGANWLMVGSRSSSNQAEDYYTPQLLELGYDSSVTDIKERGDQELEANASKDRMAGGLRLCTYNIGRFSGGQTAASSVTADTYNRLLARYREIVKLADADIICLEEYNDIFCSNVGGVQKLAKDVLFEDYPVRHLNADLPGSSMYNISIFSHRWLHNFTKSYLPSDATRYYMVSDYELNGETVKVVACHLGFTASDNDAATLGYLNELITALAAYDYVILCGDMNMLADGAHFAVLTSAGYTIANCGSFGNLETYNGNDARVVNRCIDQIAVKGFRMSGVRMVDAAPTDTPYIVSGLSDHYPLVCDLVMTNI